MRLSRQRTRLRLSVCAVLLLAAAESAAVLKNAYPYGSCFEIASRMHDVPVELLLAVASVESALNPDARSNKNAHGIMQIQWPGTAKHLGVKRVSELYNPCLNIELGARYLRELLDANGGDVERALAAYNYGPGRIRRSTTLPEGARGYASKVAAKQTAIESRARQGAAALPAGSGVRFDSRHRAERFASTLDKRISGATFVSRRTRSGAYEITMVVGDTGLSATDVTTLESLGWSQLGGAP